MRIGARFNRGEEVYGENSYYPLPYVMIFGILAALPRPLSMALWLLAPVLAALWITGWRPWVLIYSPLFGHFLGGQTALFGLLGFWGYRRYPAADRFSGGIWLALTLLKPQLGVIPCAWAAWHWWQSYREERRLPRQLIAFVATTAAIYLPAFILQPDWVQRWLSNPRPLFERAMAGLIPRGLVLLRLDGWWFLAIWLVLALLSLYGVTRLFQKRISLDVLTLWYFFVSPLVHDYDLIQTIPLVEKAGERWAAVLLGLPALWVILFAYGNDAAWIAITIIAPGLLLVKSKGAIRSLDEIQGARTAP